MKAEEFLNIKNDAKNNHIIILTEEQRKDIYNSLKRLEGLEAKQTPRYVLSRDIEGIAKKGDACYLDEDNFWFTKDKDLDLKKLIAHKDAIDPTLIVEQKAIELWIDKRAINNTASAYIRTEPKDGCIKFVEVLNER